jgi:hypothetical protein
VPVDTIQFDGSFKDGITKFRDIKGRSRGMAASVHIPFLKQPAGRRSKGMMNSFISRDMVFLADPHICPEKRIL